MNNNNDLVVNYSQQPEVKENVGHGTYQPPPSNYRAQPQPQAVAVNKKNIVPQNYGQTSYSNNTLLLIFGAVCCCCCCFIVTIIIIAALADGELTELPPSSEELRSGNDHVGVLFAEDPGANARNAFVNAARRWSDIVEGTPIVGSPIEEGDDICDFLPFSDSFFLDHLLIISDVSSNDGPGGILASAGPCAVDPVSSSQFPIVGFMSFDADDIDNLISDGTFETVILHEMGHVLGVGTLWSFSRQGSIQAAGPFEVASNERLLQDPIFDIDTGNVAFPPGNPRFIGQRAVEEFELLGGNGAVPVEDGSGGTSSRGSIDGHWSIVTFNNELMVFAINANNNVFPLSTVTIASLEDLGYNVDILLADEFDLFPTVVNKRTVGDEAVHDLIDDIYKVELKVLGL